MWIKYGTPQYNEKKERIELLRNQIRELKNKVEEYEEELKHCDERDLYRSCLYEASDYVEADYPEVVLRVKGIEIKYENRDTNEETTKFIETDPNTNQWVDEMKKIFKTVFLIPSRISYSSYAEEIVKCARAVFIQDNQTVEKVNGEIWYLPVLYDLGMCERACGPIDELVRSIRLISDVEGDENMLEVEKHEEQEEEKVEYTVEEQIHLADKYVDDTRWIDFNKGPVFEHRLNAVNQYLDPEYNGERFRVNRIEITYYESYNDTKLSINTRETNPNTNEWVDVVKEVLTQAFLDDKDLEGLFIRFVYHAAINKYLSSDDCNWCWVENTDNARIVTGRFITNEKVKVRIVKNCDIEVNQKNDSKTNRKSTIE